MAKLLTICPYPLLPPRGGGALRCFHLLRQLARVHEVHAIIFQPESELRRPNEGCVVPDSVRVYSPIDNPPPPNLFDLLPGRLAKALHYRWLRRSPRGPASSELLRAHHLIHQIVTGNPIDVVVFETLGAMAAAPFARRLRPDVRLILDAHNVESLLLERQLGNGKAPSERQEAELARLRRTERTLDQNVNAVWACSEKDSREFKVRNNLPIFTVPNGVDTGGKPFDRKPDKRERLQLLFCGSLNYPPNWQGVTWFLQYVWPLVRKANSATGLTIVGSGARPSEFGEELKNANVNFAGETPDLAPYYERASVAVCPLLTGSGTRLKILEAMSFGVPVVSTQVGAEGIEAVNGSHLLLADTPEDFARAIGRLLSEPMLYDNIRQSARRLVEQRYDWNVIGQVALNALEAVLTQS